MIVGYIAKQKTHHRSKTFAEEYRACLVKNGVEIKEEYFRKAGKSHLSEMPLGVRTSSPHCAALVW